MGLLPKDAYILPPSDDSTDNGLLSDAIHVVYVELSKLRGILKNPVKDIFTHETLFRRYLNVSSIFIFVYTGKV